MLSSYKELKVDISSSNSPPCPGKHQIPHSLPAQDKVQCPPGDVEVSSWFSLITLQWDSSQILTLDTKKQQSAPVAVVSSKAKLLWPLYTSTQAINFLFFSFFFYFISVLLPYYI